MSPIKDVFQPLPAYDKDELTNARKAATRCLKELYAGGAAPLHLSLPNAVQHIAEIALRERKALQQLRDHQ